MQQFSFWSDEIKAYWSNGKEKGTEAKNHKVRTRIYRIKGLPGLKNGFPFNSKETEAKHIHNKSD